MSDGGYVPNTPNGAPIKQNMKRQNQLYCGYDDNGGIPEPVIHRYPAQFVNTMESAAQRCARLESGKSATRRISKMGCSCSRIFGTESSLFIN